MDTNVPIVANGQADLANGGRPPSLSCRMLAVERLVAVLATGTVVLDVEGSIQAEYHRHLSPRGQPGVGDRFYLEVLNSLPGRIERVALPRDANGDFADFPNDPSLAGFDPSDRKFAALARREHIPVLAATDSDWLKDRITLAAHGVLVDLICGCDPAGWFEA